MELWHTRTCGLVPNVYAVNAYDSLMITKEIIETRGVTNKPENLETDRERIREGWATLKEFKGVGGAP